MSFDYGEHFKIGRRYRVTIEARINGVEGTFEEIVEYPLASWDARGCVCEEEREAKGVRQFISHHSMTPISRKELTLENVRAIRSISVD